MRVSFDFDGTLHEAGVPVATSLALLRDHARRGDDLWIVTTRTASHESEAWWRSREPHRVPVADFVRRHSLPVQRIVFTAHQLKATTLRRLAIERHYDNDPAEIAAARAVGVPAIFVPGDHTMLDSNSRRHITVVGDLILDRYWIGEATKLNPEMPGVVIQIKREEARLGGAANVARIAAELGARVTLAGVVGHDAAGRQLQELLDNQAIHSHLWVSARPTTWKQRIVAGGHLRPDRCDRETTTPIDRRAEEFLARVPIGDVVLISDYGKGVCTSQLLGAIRERAVGTPILVDPARGRSWSEYAGATLIKANWLEATEASGRRDLKPLALARFLAERHRCDVVVTLGRCGLVAAEREGATWHLPATPMHVRDVCGAGDSVHATVGVARSYNYSIRDGCRFATLAAARQVANPALFRSARACATKVGK